MSKDQTFRSEDMPFGIAIGKFQIPKYGICNLECEIPSASEDRSLPVDSKDYVSSGPNGFALDMS
jgi:hypothetical protein